MLSTLGRTSAILCALAAISAGDRSKERPKPLEQNLSPLQRSNLANAEGEDGIISGATTEMAKQLQSPVNKLDGTDRNPEVPLVKNGWFSPTAREVSLDQGTLLADSLNNVKERAKMMQNSAQRVLDLAQARSKGLTAIHDALRDNVTNPESVGRIAKMIERKTLEDMLSVNNSRMKWVNHMLGENAKTPKDDELLDYALSVQALEDREGLDTSSPERDRGRATMTESLLSKFPVGDLLYPHQILVARRSFGGSGLDLKRVGEEMKTVTMVKKIKRKERSGEGINKRGNRGRVHEE